MPSRYLRHDLKGIPSPIKENLEACKRGMYEDPCDLEEALSKANEAKLLAVLFKRKDIERRIRFYRAECYRKMGDWEEAYRLYQKCTVVTEEDERWLRKMQSLCRVEISKLHRDNDKWPCRDIIKRLRKDISDRLRRDIIERPRRDIIERPCRDDMRMRRRDNIERPQNDNFKRPHRDNIKRPHRDDLERSRRGDIKRPHRDIVETSRRHRDNAETSKPRKSSRPSHQEGRGYVKEHRGKRRR